MCIKDNQLLNTCHIFNYTYIFYTNQKHYTVNNKHIYGNTYTNYIHFKRLSTSILFFLNFVTI